VKEAKYVK